MPFIRQPKVQLTILRAVLGNKLIYEHVQQYYIPFANGLFVEEPSLPLETTLYYL